MLNGTLEAVGVKLQLLSEILFIFQNLIAILGITLMLKGIY